MFELSQHLTLTVGTVFVIAVGIGYALYRHSMACKQSRDRLHARIDSMASELNQRFDKLYELLLEVRK